MPKSKDCAELARFRYIVFHRSVTQARLMDRESERKVLTCVRLAQLRYAIL